MNKNGTETGWIAKMAKDFWDTSNALGSKIMAAKACKDFRQFLTSSKIEELDNL